MKCPVNTHLFPPWWIKPAAKTSGKDSCSQFSWNNIDELWRKYKIIIVKQLFEALGSHQMHTDPLGHSNLSQYPLAKIREPNCCHIHVASLRALCPAHTGKTLRQKFTVTAEKADGLCGQSEQVDSDGEPPNKHRHPIMAELWKSACKPPSNLWLTQEILPPKGPGKIVLEGRKHRSEISSGALQQTQNLRL